MRAESAKVPDLSGAVVTVVEPGLPAGRARLLRRDDQWALENTHEYERQPPSSADPELHISPGWVDLHAHVYDGMTEISVPPTAWASIKAFTCSLTRAAREQRQSADLRSTCFPELVPRCSHGSTSALTASSTCGRSPTRRSSTSTRQSLRSRRTEI